MSSQESEVSLAEITLLAGVGLLVVVHLFTLVIVPGGLSLLELAGIELVLGVVVSGALGSLERSVRVGVLAGTCVTASAVAAWWLGAQAGPSVWTVALCIGTGGALVMYAIHRYELVTLGIVEEST